MERTESETRDIVIKCSDKMLRGRANNFQRIGENRRKAFKLLGINYGKGTRVLR